MVESTDTIIIICIIITRHPIYRHTHTNCQHGLYHQEITPDRAGSTTEGSVGYVDRVPPPPAPRRSQVGILLHTYTAM